MIKPFPGISPSTGAKDYIAQLAQRGRLWIIPHQAGWAETLVGTADSSLGAAFLWVRELAINSSAVRSASILGMGAGSAIGVAGINWGKKLRILFLCARGTTAANVVARFQLKQVATEGVLAAPGLGIEIAGYAMYGESYGSGRATVDLTTTMSEAIPYWAEIIHYPALKDEWYANKVLKGTQSTAANIPSGQLDVSTIFVVSMVSAGSTNNCLNRLLSPVYIWQEM